LSGDFLPKRVRRCEGSFSPVREEFRPLFVSFGAIL
jgi:hypothetical protein